MTLYKRKSTHVSAYKWGVDTKAERFVMYDTIGGFHYVLTAQGQIVKVDYGEIIIPEDEQPGDYPRAYPVSEREFQKRYEAVDEEEAAWENVTRECPNEA